MSTTPRTDAAYFEADEIEHATDADVTIAMRDFARELECENARLRETLEAALQAAELDASCNSEELRQVRKELARTVSAMAELSGENAELRKDRQN